MRIPGFGRYFKGDPATTPTLDGDMYNRSSAEMLAELVSRIGEDPDLPSFTEHLRAILAGLQSPTANLHQISVLVLQDYSLALQIVRTANSALYNRSGRPLQDVQQAMMMLGSRVVRELAAGVVFFEQYSRRSPAVRDVLLNSTLTGAHARELAARVGLEHTEGAYLCGLFYNLGELLVAAHFPREHREITSGLSGERKYDRFVVRAAIGCDYEELGVAVGRAWNLPEEVLRAMRASGDRRERALLQVVRMAHELTLATSASDSAQRTQRIDACFRAFSQGLRVTRLDILDVMKTAAEDTKGLFACAGVTMEEPEIATHAPALISR